MPRVLFELSKAVNLSLNPTFTRFKSIQVKLKMPPIFPHWNELLRPTVYDQNFGLALLDNDLMLSPRHLGYNRCPAVRAYQRPWRFIPDSKSGLSHIQNDKKNFAVNLDVQQFKPDEISVKVADGYIVVDGKHEERNDEHGFISRQFTRRYKIPENVDPSAITSTLSSDGVLSVGAPKKDGENFKNEREVPIVHTNEPSIKVSEEKEKEKN